MKSTGQNNDKASYRILLLLVVGLTAFSSAMKELNQVQQLGVDASRLIAHWSATIVPVEVPQAPLPMVVKAESCELKQSKPSVELPWLTHDAQAESEIEETEAPVVVKRSSAGKFDVVKVKRERRIEVNPVQFEVRIPPDHDGEAETFEVVVPEIPVSSFSAPPFKFKNRRNGSIRINSRDREMLFKTFNRSINLRIAG